MNIDLLLRNGQVVFPYGGTIKADIGVSKGKIVGIYENTKELKADKVIDVGGKSVLPGMIDSHTHIGLGSNIENEYESESQSAAVGGVTTMMSYTNCRDSYDDHYRTEKKVGEEKSIIDFALHFGFMNNIHLKEIHHYIEELGVSSFKFFMNFRGEEGKYLGVEGIDDGYMFDLFVALSHYPESCAVVHAENIEVAWRLSGRLRAEGRDDLLAWTESKPHFIEAEAIQRALFYGEIANCSVYIAHVSTRDGLQVIRDYKQRGKKAYCETCPHYLMFHAGSGLGSLGKVNPPLRSSEDTEALWRGISEGLVDTIGTDHCPNPRETKTGDIWSARPGFPGSATMLPILLSEGVNKKRISLERVAEITSCNTAKIFNLFPRKGTIQVGSDADLCIVDLNLSKKVEAKMLQSQSDFSLYEGWDLKGWPTLTMVRGKIVMKDGGIVGPKGHGRYIPTIQ